MSLLAAMSSFTAQAFVDGLWQGLVLIAAVAVCFRMLPRVSAAVRFAVWGLAFALLVVTPMLHVRTTAVRASSAALHVSAVWGIAIAAVWAALMVVRTVQLLQQAARLRRIWKRATPVAIDDATVEILRESGRGAELCISADVDSPSVIGFFAPRLLVPEWLFAKVTDVELRQIVLHECEHLRRGDDWINLAQKIGMAVFPLNPALLWVDRRLSLERELACDAGVVAATAAPFDYAHCLTRLAEHRMGYRRIALALSAWSRQPELSRRVHSLLKPMRQMSVMHARVSVAVLGVGLAGGAVEMARAPRLISFTDAVATPVAEAVAVPPHTAAVPVVYRETGQGRAVLLKATLPAPSKKSARVRTMPARMSQVVASQPREILTRAAVPEPTVQHYRQMQGERQSAETLSIEFSSSYAAVPFGDGWLIIQL
jgi:beta-lactamase regulating signal transducer with metallopeptidase domain